MSSLVTIGDDGDEQVGKQNGGQDLVGQQQGSERTQLPHGTRPRKGADSNSWPSAGPGPVAHHVHYNQDCTENSEFNYWNGVPV